MTEYRKANIHFGPSTTVGQTIGEYIINPSVSLSEEKKTMPRVT